MQATVNSGRDPRRNLRLFGFLFASIGALCLCIAIGMAVYHLWFIHNAQQTYGRVVDFDESTDDDGSVTYHPVFVFLDQSGKEHGIHSHGGSNPAGFEVGDTVNVLYLAGRPDEAVINTFFQMWGPETIVGSMGIVFFVIGALFIVVTKKERPSAIRKGFGGI